MDLIYFMRMERVGGEDSHFRGEMILTERCGPVSKVSTMAMRLAMELSV